MYSPSGSYSRGTASVLVVVVLATLSQVVYTTPALAACPAPSISVEPSSGAPGSSVTVRGEHFTSGCEDVGEGQGSPPPEPPPDEDVPIWFVQDGQRWRLTTVDADSEYRFEVTVQVPEDAAEGAAEIVAEGENGSPSAPFVVHGPSAADVEQLPETGFSLVPIVGLAFLLSALGIGVVAESRRRATPLPPTG